jgi:hypothetical protein
VRARTAIDLAIDVFDIFGHSFAVATSAARIARELRTKAESVVQDNRHSQGQIQTQPMGDASLLLQPDVPLQTGLLTDKDLAAAGMGMMDGAVDFGNLLQMACDVEQWIDLSMLWPPPQDVYMEPWAEVF